MDVHLPFSSIRRDCISLRAESSAESATEGTVELHACRRDRDFRRHTRPHERCETRNHETTNGFAGGTLRPE